MKVLGITGGVGSGKSRILEELKNEYGAFIIEADKVAHELMSPGKTIYNAIIEHFGKDILMNDAPYEIDRKKLGDIVFSDKERLRELNSISHPLVKEQIKQTINNVSKLGKHRLIVIEAALLIQDGYKEICDEIWYIQVDEEERIKRLIKQRGYTRQKCLDMFSSQDSDEYYKKYADFTINNQLDFENSSKQLKALLNIFLSNDIMN